MLLAYKYHHIHLVWSQFCSNKQRKQNAFVFRFRKNTEIIYENLLVVLGAFVWFFEPSTHTIFHREETNLSDTMKYSALSSSFRISLSINTSTQVLIIDKGTWEVCEVLCIESLRLFWVGVAHFDLPLSASAAVYETTLTQLKLHHIKHGLEVRYED